MQNTQPPTEPTFHTPMAGRGPAGPDLAVGQSCPTAPTIVSAAVMSMHDDGDGSTQYRIYIGLNDRDTGTQLVSVEDAKDTLDRICDGRVDGYTIQVSEGVWTDDNGDRIRETSLICVFDGTDVDTIHRICDDLRTSLNQASILIESSEVRTEYYSGS